jgi:hypothetical protein
MTSKRYYFLLGAIVVLSAGYIGWRLATPPIPDAQLSGDLMDRVELPRTLSDSDTDALLRLLRSDDPIAVRNALGAAMEMTKSPRKAQVLAALDTVPIPTNDTEGIADAVKETRRRLSK